MNPLFRLFCTGLLAGAVLLSGCTDKDEQDSQVLARVEGVEITVHQLENALRVAKSQKRDAETRQRLLEQLIDRELAVQQAEKLKMDERPEVMLRIEELKRDVLASTWGDSIMEQVNAPTDADARRYYDDHPALFSERRVYAMEETVWPLLDESVRRIWQEGKTLPGDEVVARLRAAQAPSRVQTVQRAAENLPIEVAVKLLQAASGSTVTFETPQVLMTYRPLSFQSAPLGFEAAQPRIRAFLTRAQSNEALANAVAALRKQARVEYLQPKAEAPADAASPSQ